MNDLMAKGMDRISDLPRPILHHILSHLSQNDAVKTCVLSKSWRHLWYGRPNVEFCKDNFKGLTVQKFISVLDQTLIRYDTQNLSIQKFILKMHKTNDPAASGPFLEKWIPKIVMRNIKCIETFHLSFHQRVRSAYFDLPSEIFLSESLREIHLEGCKLNQTTDKVLFRHLQTLRLHDVHIEEETFERIMSSCPLIEEVSLNYCEGLKTVKLNNYNSSLKTINLFTHLKSLSLRCVNLTTKTVLCNCTSLEELELSHCLNSDEEFQLSSRSIKRLAIKNYNLTKVCIDAPNILKFEYEGYDFPPPFSFTTTSNKWESKIGFTMTIDMDDIDYIPQWLHKLDELLKVLSGSETSVHIVVYVDFDDYHWYGTPYDEIEEVVKHLELCLGSHLCSHYSVWLDVDELHIGKRLIKSSD